MTDSLSKGEDVNKSAIRWGVLIRNILKIRKFNVYRMKDIDQFFKEYKSFCKKKFGKNSNFG